MKKIISVLLVFTLVMTLMPLSVFARGEVVSLSHSIILNPVDSISYTPREGCITRYFEMGGNFEDDGNGGNYYRYNVIERSTGDVLTVNYNDGRGTVNYVLKSEPEWMYVSETDENDIILENDVDMFDEQWKTHYALGDSNYVYVEYMGKRATVRVSIINNPISSLIYVPARDIEIYENSNGWWDTDESGDPVYRYNSPRFSAGDRLEITYSDTGDTVVYTYLDYFDEEDREWHRGFFDENREELPENDSLYISGTDGWHLGEDNYISVFYKDNESNKVKVKISPNPVKEIRFERNTDVVLVEGIDMRHDDWDDRDYYDIPYHRSGDKLTVIDNNDKQTVYEYQDNGVFVSEGKDDIPTYDVHIYSDQHDKPWELGKNEYTIEYMGKTCTLTATVIKNPVKAIRYEPAHKTELFENTNGSYNEEFSYYHYWYNWCDDGDKLIVIDTDNNETEYEYMLTGKNTWERAFIAENGDIIESNRVRFDDEQQSVHWHIGNDNEYYVEYLGARYTLYATIKENLVKSISFKPFSKPTVMVGVRSYYEPEIDAEIFDTPRFNAGDELTVVDKYDNTKVYTAQYNEQHDIVFKADNGEEIDGYDLWCDSNQWDEPWSIGDNNEYFIEYLNNRCTVKCTLIDNPVDSIDFIPAEKTVYLEGTNMFYDEWREFNVYEMPRVNNGDKLIVNYKDETRGRVEYIANFDNANDIMTYVSSNGDKIVEDDMFEFRDEQDFEPWSVGENYYTIMYCGKAAQVPVIIKENKIASISYTSIELPQVWITDFEMDTDEETGGEYKHYNIPDFMDGDILTVTDTDGNSTDYTLVFDESDGERYFVNGDEKYHQYTLFRFDNQHENEWKLGRGNYYSVDFYGFTVDIEVEIIETEVESISFSPVEAIQLPEYYDGEYIRDENGEKFYFYNRVQIINAGDSLTVTYKNGDVVTYILGNDGSDENWVLRSEDGREINPYEINIDDHQRENHWRVGENSFEISYHGARTSVPVIINHIPGDIAIENIFNATLTEKGSYVEVLYCAACGEEISRTNKEIPVISADAPRIEIETKKACLGKTVDVKINFKNNPGITSAKLIVNFSEILKLKNVEFGVNTGMTEISENLNGPVTLNWFNNHKSYNTSDFMFATLTFKIAEDAEIGMNDITAVYDPEDIYNVDEQNIDFAVFDGGVEVVNHLVGEIVTENEIPATCAKNGSYDEVVYCTICGDEISRTHKVIFSPGHNYNAVITAPTCTEQGYTTHTCTSCGYSYVDSYTNALGHTGGIATCHTKAFCERCGTEYGEFNASNHDGETEIRNAKSPACTVAGYTGDTYCLGCGEIIAIGTEISAPGHNYNAVITAPTCTEQGYTTHTCSRCGDSYIDSYTDALGHSGGTATCHSKAVCTRCGECYGEFDPNNHEEVSYWIIDKRATLTDLGSKHKECLACGKVIETQIIPIVDANAPRIEIETKKACAGKTVDVKINFKNNPGITSAKLKIDFSDILTLKKISYGVSTGYTMPPEVLISPATLNWFIGNADLKTKDFAFATLTFEVAENAEIGMKDIKIAYDPDDIYNIDDENIDFAVIDGGVEVVDHIAGDINGDGKVNNKDITRLFQYLSDWDVSVNKAALDINNDNAVNNKDLTRLFRYLSGWNVEIF